MDNPDVFSRRQRNLHGNGQLKQPFGNLLLFQRRKLIEPRSAVACVTWRVPHASYVIEHHLLVIAPDRVEPRFVQPCQDVM